MYVVVGKRVSERSITGVCNKNKTFTNISRYVRENFAKFSEVFGSFRKLSEVFGSFPTRSDAFGCVRMLLGRKKSRKIEMIKKNMYFHDVFKKLRKDGAGHTPPHGSEKKTTKCV